MKSSQLHTNDWKGKDTFPISTYFWAMTESVSVLFSLRSQNILKCKNKHTSTREAERTTPLEGTILSQINAAIWIWCRVCFLLGNSPASEFYRPTFRNTLFHLHRQVVVEWLGLRNVGTFIPENFRLQPNLFPYKCPNTSQTYSFYTYLPMKMEQPECSETSAYKIQRPSKYPEESV